MRGHDKESDAWNKDDYLAENPEFVDIEDKVSGIVKCVFERLGWASEDDEEFQEAVRAILQAYYGDQLMALNKGSNGVVVIAMAMSCAYFYGVEHAQRAIEESIDDFEEANRVSGAVDALLCRQQD